LLGIYFDIIRKDAKSRAVQGKVFSTVFSPDDPLTLAAGGSKAKVQIWDVGTNQGARKAFGKKLAQAGRTLKEKATGGVIGVVSDDESGDELESDG
jgi:periodic tryptophan protein 1